MTTPKQKSENNLNKLKKLYPELSKNIQSFTELVVHEPGLIGMFGNHITIMNAAFSGMNIKLQSVNGKLPEGLFVKSEEKIVEIAQKVKEVDYIEVIKEYNKSQ